MARRPLVMGNWKLNGSKAFTKELIEGLKAELHDVTGCDVAIAPPRYVFRYGRSSTFWLWLQLWR